MKLDLFWEIEIFTFLIINSIHVFSYGNNTLLEDTQSSSQRRSSCYNARIKCALRKGCGAALQSYMLDCHDLMMGRVNFCDDFCKVSLIALTSTEEGVSLMDCECNDDYCLETKSRVEVCRAEVLRANRQGAVLSCSIAHLICTADTQCGTALSFYEKHCRRMFDGRSCDYRCNNSLSILSGQEKADKLSQCECDGTEPFNCTAIKKNMEKLCFPQKEQETKIEEHEVESEKENEIDIDSKVTKNKTSSSCSTFVPNNLLVISEILAGLVSADVVRWLYCFR